MHFIRERLFHIKTFGKIKTFFDLPTLLFWLRYWKHRFYYDKPYHHLIVHKVQHTTKRTKIKINEVGSARATDGCES